MRKEVEARWGDTAAFAEYEIRSRGRSEKEQQDIADGLNAIFGRFAECRRHGYRPDSEEARSLVCELQEYITANYYNCTDEILRGLGAMYTGDERFRTNINKHGDGAAEFASAAIERFTETCVIAAKDR